MSVGTQKMCRAELTHHAGFVVERKPIHHALSVVIDGPRTSLSEEARMRISKLFE